MVKSYSFSSAEMPNGFQAFQNYSQFKRIYRWYCINISQMLQGFILKNHLLVCILFEISLIFKTIYVLFNMILETNTMIYNKSMNLLNIYVSVSILE